MSTLIYLLTKQLKPTKFPFFIHTIPLSFSTLISHKTPNFINPKTTPPTPKKIPFKLTLHGGSWNDPYHWMSNINDPDFTSYLLHENLYADGFMSDTVGLQKELFSEMVNRLPGRIETAAERWVNWLYYQYIPEGKEYPVLCRRLDKRSRGFGSLLTLLTNTFRREEVLLDWNEISEKYGYVHVGTCRVSPDHNFLAYTLDINGSERFSLQIKDLRNGHALPSIKADSVVSLAWAKDSSVIFYTICDDNQRPYRVHCKNMRSEVDTVIFTEDDARFCLDITSTKDGEFITINSNSRTSSEVFVVNSISPLDSLRRVHRRVDGVQYFLEHHEGFFYVLTNNPTAEVEMLPLERFYMGICRVEDRDSTNWQEIKRSYNTEILWAETGDQAKMIKALYKKGFWSRREIRVPANIDTKTRFAICSDNGCTSKIKYVSVDDTIILPSEGTSLQDMDMFDKYLVLSLDMDGSSVMCSINLPIDAKCKNVLELQNLNPWVFPMPCDVCRIAPGSNHDYLTTTYRAVLSSLVMPDLVVDYDMSSRKFSLIHQEEVLHATRHVPTNPPDHRVYGNLMETKYSIHKEEQSFEGLRNWEEFSSSYACETHDVVSHDGKEVPLTIVYSKDRETNVQSPGLLEAYGAYGEVLDKSWCSDRVSLLERGWVLAFADVRGGGGSGPSWHQQGSGANKMNSVYDYVSCAKYLFNEGYTQKDRLAAIGCSAGSLLVGAAINSHPDLFSAAILKVPFLDICSTLMDESLPLTIMDHEEFGNPKIEAQFKTIMKYSPYDNIAKGSCYPPMLVTAAFNDSRVGVWEAAKWVAKVRESTCSSCSQSVILKTEMKGGHFGEGGRYGHSKEKAYEYSFLLKVVGQLDSSMH